MQSWWLKASEANFPLTHFLLYIWKTLQGSCLSWDGSGLLLHLNTSHHTLPRRTKRALIYCSSYGPLLKSNTWHIFLYVIDEKRSHDMISRGMELQLFLLLKGGESYILVSNTHVYHTNLPYCTIVRVKMNNVHNQVGQK